MVVAAVVAEYNPFHNGHAAHLAATRQAGATHIVVIMSGNYTQRGSAAVAEKHVRAECALAAGADLVIELPLPYAMATAQRFAAGAVALAVAMGCVDTLSFGSESGYLSMLQAAAAAVDSPDISARLHEHLDEGMTFARARQTAVSEICGDEVADLLASPNDSLAIEYLRALSHCGSGIIPFAVHRTGAGHDTVGTVGDTASATHLRALLRAGKTDEALALMPAPCARIFRRAMADNLAVYDESRLETAMLCVLRRMSDDDFSALPDLSEGIEHRIASAVQRAASLDEVYALAKSKRYPAARIRRVVMSAFLALPGDMSACTPPYLRVLGFNERGREVLSRMKDTAALPVSDRLAYLRDCGGAAARFAAQEARATDLYLLGLSQARPCGFDYITPSIRLI